MYLILIVQGVVHEPNFERHLYQSSYCTVHHQYLFAQVNQFEWLCILIGVR